MVINALQQNGNVLYLKKKLYQGDGELVLAAVRNNGISLEFASDELKGDREIALKAVKKFAGHLSMLASYKLLQNDRDSVLSAVEQLGSALHFANRVGCAGCGEERTAPFELHTTAAGIFPAS